MESSQEETVKCPRCSTLNNAGSRFCVACGTALGAEWQALERFVDERVTERVRIVLKENFADQKAVEIETSELIAERAVKWAKTFGFFVGIPVAVAALVVTIGAAILGIIGLRTWSDIGTAQKELTTATLGLTGARSQLDEAKARTKEALDDAEAFKREIKDNRELLAAIPGLQQRTKNLEEILKLDEFRKYLGVIGLRIPDKAPSIKITTNNDVVSYFDQREQQIVVSTQAAKDPSVVLREYMHSLLFVQKGQVSDTRMDELYAVESFVAFYIPASFLNSPKIGSIYSQGQSQDYLFNLQGPSMTSLRRNGDHTRARRCLGDYFGIFVRRLGVTPQTNLSLPLGRNFPVSPPANLHGNF